MKIGIISDTHGSEMRWEKAYEKYLSHTDLILHAGDVLYHGPRNRILPDYNPAGLAERINRAAVPVVIARGNCDAEVDTTLLNVPVQEPYAYIWANGRSILLTHGHAVASDQAKEEMARHCRAGIFISGHIHTPVLEKRNGIIFINPGSPSLSKREDHRSTIAVLSEQEIVIVDFDADEILSRLPLE